MQHMLNACCAQIRIQKYSCMRLMQLCTMVGM